MLQAMWGWLMHGMLRRVVRDERGQGMVEYALILFLVSVAAIIVLGLLGDQIVGVFNNILTALGGGGQ